MRYSVQPRDQIFEKSYGRLSFSITVGKNIVKNICKNLSGEHSPGMLAMHQKLLDHAKQSATDMLKSDSEGTIQKTAEATGDLIGNKIAKITNVHEGKISEFSQIEILEKKTEYQK